MCLRVFLLGAFVSVTGCSSLFGQEGYFRDRGDDYLKADVIAPMTLPEGISSDRIEQLYAIPASHSNSFDELVEFEVPRPQPLSDNAFTDKVKIQKVANNRWILINAAPAEVWPKVRQFLSANRLEVVFTDATTGVIETGWLQFKSDEKNKDKYRLQIEQGVQPGSSEVHVLHMSVSQKIPGRGQVNWPKQSINPEREAWMLDELASTLASDTTTGQSASLLAQTIGVSDKVELLIEDKEPLLRLDLDYTRAWATVGYAVKKEGFTLWDQDDVVGVYHVDFQEVDEDEEDDSEPGFFSRLFSSDEGDEQSSPYDLATILTHLQLADTEANRKIFASVSSRANTALSDVPGYLVVVRGLEGKIEIRIRDGYARNLAPKEAKKLLNIIRRNLI